MYQKCAWKIVGPLFKNENRTSSYAAVIDVPSLRDQPYVHEYQCKLSRYQRFNTFSVIMIFTLFHCLSQYICTSDC